MINNNIHLKVSSFNEGDNMFSLARVKLYYVVAIVALFLIQFPATAQMFDQARIVHIPLIKATAGDEVLIEARVEGAAGTLVAALLYYKSPSQMAFKVNELDVDGWNFSGIIPITDIVPPSIEYYLEAEISSGEKIQFPVGALETNRTFEFIISPIGAEEGIVSSAVDVLSPSPGSKIEGDEALIAMTLKQFIQEIDPENVHLMLNGVDVTNRAIISAEIVSLIIKKLRPGVHRVALFEQKGEEKHRLIGFSFTVEAEKVAKRARKLPFKGSAGVRYSHEDISSKVRDITKLNGKIAGKAGKLRWGGNAHITSLESDELQPQNRFSGSLNYRALAIKGGDTQPRFSQFTMWGVRNRGAEFNLHSPYFSLDVASGNMLKAIDGELGSLDTTYVTNSFGDTLTSEINPGMDSIRVDTTIVTGTYRRSMLAVSPGFPLSKNLSLSINLFKAKDDIESINYGKTPKDNLVFGTDIEYQSSNRRFKFSSEVALSMYNSDISGGPMSGEAENLENIIVVNQFLEPLPNDSAILDEEIEAQKLLELVLDELIASAMANQTSVSLSIFHNELKVDYKSVGRSFKSLGSPAIQTDVQGLSISDRLRLFKNRLYLNIGYEALQDNVNGRAETTLDRQTISGGFTIYTPPSFPNLNFSTRLFGRENDSEIIYVTLPDGSKDSTGNPVGDQSETFDFSIDQVFRIANFDHTIAISFSQTANEDDYNPDGASNLSNTTIRLSSQQGKKLSANAALSLTSQSSLNETNKIDYKVISLRGRYMALENMLWLSGGLNTTIASGGLTPYLDPVQTTASGYTLDFTRLDFSLGADLTINKHHKLGITASKVAQTDDGFVEQYARESDSDPWEITKTMNKDLPNFIEQNDLVARLKYTFKF